MNDVDGAHGGEEVGVRKGVQDFPGVLEDFDLPRPQQAAHHEAVVPLRLPDGSEPGQPAPRVVVVSSEEQTGGRRKRETFLSLPHLLQPIFVPCKITSRFKQDPACVPGGVTGLGWVGGGKATGDKAEGSLAEGTANRSSYAPGLCILVKVGQTLSHRLVWVGGTF